MARIRKLSDLSKELKKIAANVMQNEVLTKVKELQQTWILKEVYLAYSPKQYERRGNYGGLIDERNILGVFSAKDTTLTVSNVTEYNNDYTAEPTSEYLAPLIEFGHKAAVAKGYRGYSFPYRQLAYYRPRPFIAKTREDLAENKHHIKAMKEGLNRLGIQYRD